MLVIWKQQEGIGNVDKTNKRLTEKEFDEKYPHLKDHADYKNYGSKKKKPNSFAQWVLKKESEKKNSK